MPSREELYQALRNADKAGDTEGAKKLASYIQSLPAEDSPAVKPETSLMADIGTGLKKTAQGAALGVSDIGNTVLNTATYLPGKVADRARADLPETLKHLVPDISQWNRTRNADFEAITDQNKDSTAFKVGRVAGNVAATLPVGGTLAAGARIAAPGAVGFANALATSGMRAGATPGVANMLTRMAGGAVTGGASSALISPENAGAGAVIGGLLPPALAGIGKVGRAIGGTIAGPAISTEIRQAVESARAAGYVIPPTQAKPTLFNRALEGFSGKITTAQNASAKNQPITNELAKKAIGAADLTESGIAQVRKQANQAYDALGQVGKFQADAGFAQALDRAGANTSAMRQNFPELVNSEVDDLIAGLKSRGEFEAQPTIEAIKQFRSNASANKNLLDPAKKALGKAQSNIANALEDLIDRNLQVLGNQGLLNSYRTARQTLAKTYDVEKALNVTSRNVDGNKLAQALKKGRPLTNELRTIADFAAHFPKANQTVEKMGSLPQVSPLDFGALGTVSAVSGNPLVMAGVLARPAARALVLSNPVQNRLATAAGQGGPGILTGPTAEQLLYRSGPAVSAR